MKVVEDEYHLMGSTTNGLVTYGSSSSGVVESNLTFNGSTNLLTVNGTMNTGTITISNSSTSGELDIQGGKIYLRGENASNHGGILYLFDKDNTNFIAFTGGTGISSNYTITLPSSPLVVTIRYYYQILLVICLGQIKVLVEEVVYHSGSTANGLVTYSSSTTANVSSICTIDSVAMNIGGGYIADGGSGGGGITLYNYGRISLRNQEPIRFYESTGSGYDQYITLKAPDTLSGSGHTAGTLTLPEDTGTLATTKDTGIHVVSILCIYFLSL